jgi:hypothetical protein
MLARCIGHCNVQTDIKESVFLGRGDGLVACGSDDGRVFIYDAGSGALVKALEADDDGGGCFWGGGKGGGVRRRARLLRLFLLWLLFCRCGRAVVHACHVSWWYGLGAVLSSTMDKLDPGS